MFHVSPTDFRSSIMKNGLDPRKVKKFGFTPSSIGTEVYLFADLGEARWYRDYMSKQDPVGPMDIWIVNVDDMKLHKDYGLTDDPTAETSAYYVKKPIQNTKIRLYLPG